MPNNPLHLPNGNAQVKFNIEFKPELLYMIQESGLDHLEAIVNQIERYEKLEPRWNWMKNIMSGCGALFLAGIGILLSVELQKQPVDPQLLSWITTGTIASFIGFLICVLTNHLHNKESKEKYTSEASKIREIVRKVRSSVVQD